MATFLKGLGASFPFDISTHTGPPGNNNNVYADSEAIIASTNGVGFGIQSVNVGDGKEYVTGTYPTSRENWAHNFRTYAAPVHHLQTNAPGAGFFAEGYLITAPSGISVDPTGEATVTCTSDCSPFSGAQIYVAGNSNNALNGIWEVNCGATSCAGHSAAQCTPPTLSFCVGSGLAGATGGGGIVWGPDYWPVVMPFAVQHGVTSIEVWQCSLDYAFGASPTEGNFPTTNWVSNESSSGCAEWGIVGSGTSGVDLGYQNTLGDTRIGQPASTSTRAGTSILINGTQF
jgi:hypothetical protein